MVTTIKVLVKFETMPTEDALNTYADTMITAVDDYCNNRPRSFHLEPPKPEQIAAGDFVYRWVIDVCDASAHAKEIFKLIKDVTCVGELILVKVLDHDYDITHKNEKGYYYLRTLSDCQKEVRFTFLANAYSNTLFQKKRLFYPPTFDMVKHIQKTCKQVMEELSTQSWKQDEFRKEMLIAAEGIIVATEIIGKVAGYPVERITDTKKWLEIYSEDWLKKNKPSELKEAKELYLTLDEKY